MLFPVLSVSIRPSCDQPPVKSRLRQGRQESDHGRDDAGALNELKLATEDVRRVAVESHDEPAHDLEARPLQRLHRLHEVAAAVLQFSAFLQALQRGRLEPDENLLETGADHEVAELGVVGQVGRRLGQEAHLRAGPRRATR